MANQSQLELFSRRMKRRLQKQEQYNCVVPSEFQKALEDFKQISNDIQDTVQSNYVNAWEKMVLLPCFY